MASTFGTLEIAKSGMMTYNAALQTVAHNIANIDTKGYSKQITNRTSTVCNKNAFLVQGTGVTVTHVSRLRNEYYDTKFQTFTSTYNKYSTEQYYLKSVEDIFTSGIVSEKGTPLSRSFDDFNATLSSLVGNPNNATLRTQLVTRGETFCEMVSTIASDLKQLQEEANTEIKTCVDQINAYADKIVALNKQINTVEAYGQTANDLRDQRAVLIDELSEYCSVETAEILANDGVGDPQYYVYLNGGILVDTYNTTKLVLNQKETYANINDNPGLYTISWADGNSFSQYSSKVGGKLQSLFEIRDGNNGTVETGEIISAESGKIVLQGEYYDSVFEMNMPANDGELRIGNIVIPYASFEAVQDPATGLYTYTFSFDDKYHSRITEALEGRTATVGTSVETKGIPYYMAQLNEFTRTYAMRFNELQNSGYDQNGNLGTTDFFSGKVPTDDADYILSEDTTTIQSVISKSGDVYNGNYFNLTALNFCVKEAMTEDSSLLACMSSPTAGSDNGDVVQKMSLLKDDANMFVHGQPDAFLQNMISAMGVNSARAESLAKSQSNLLYAVDTNRKSVSGVDEDEEGQDLIVFQNMLNNQYKVLSVLNEVLDKLINETAL